MNFLQDCLQKARDLCPRSSKSRYQLADHTVMFDKDSRNYRWFVLPSEAAECLKGNEVHVDGILLPFCPPGLRETIGLPAFMVDKTDVDDVNNDQSDIKHVLRNDDSVTYFASLEDEGSSKSFSEGLSECIERGFQYTDTEACNIGTTCDMKGDLNTDCSVSSEMKISPEGCVMPNDDFDAVKCNKSISDLGNTFANKRKNSGCFLRSNDETEMLNGVMTDDSRNSGKKNSTSNKTELIEQEERCGQGFNSESIVNSDKETMSLITSEKNNSLGESANNNSLNRKENTNTFSLNMGENTNRLNTKENTITLKTGEKVLTINKNTNRLNTEQISGTLNTTEKCQTAVIVDEAGENKERMCRKRPVALNAPSEDKQVKKIKENGDRKIKDGQIKDVISSQEMSNGTEKKKRKENKWYSPPKTIFTPFLKVKSLSLSLSGHIILIVGHKAGKILLVLQRIEKKIET